MEKEDAAQFPLIASATLAGLYILAKKVHFIDVAKLAYIYLTGASSISLFCFLTELIGFLFKKVFISLFPSLSSPLSKCHSSFPTLVLSLPSRSCTRQGGPRHPRRAPHQPRDHLHHRLLLLSDQSLDAGQFVCCCPLSHCTLSFPRILIRRPSAPSRSAI